MREPVERELAEAKARRDELAARWAKEKEALERVSQIKRRIDELKVEAERAERRASSSGSPRSATASCPRSSRSSRRGPEPGG